MLVAPRNQIPDASNALYLVVKVIMPRSHVLVTVRKRLAVRDRNTHATSKNLRKKGTDFGR